MELCIREAGESWRANLAGAHLLLVQAQEERVAERETNPPSESKIAANRGHVAQTPLGLSKGRSRSVIAAHRANHFDRRASFPYQTTMRLLLSNVSNMRGAVPVFRLRKTGFPADRPAKICPLV